MKVKFQYRMSGVIKDNEGEIYGEGKDYEDSMQNAYQTLCNERHNQFLTVTFRKED